MSPPPSPSSLLPLCFLPLTHRRRRPPRTHIAMPQCSQSFAELPHSTRGRLLCAVYHRPPHPTVARAVAESEGSRIRQLKDPNEFDMLRRATGPPPHPHPNCNLGLVHRIPARRRRCDGQPGKGVRSQTRGSREKRAVCRCPFLFAATFLGSSGLTVLTPVIRPQPSCTRPRRSRAVRDSPSRTLSLPQPSGSRVDSSTSLFLYVGGMD